MDNSTGTPNEESGDSCADTDVEEVEALLYSRIFHEQREGNELESNTYYQCKETAAGVEAIGIINTKSDGELEDKSQMDLSKAELEATLMPKVLQIASSESSSVARVSDSDNKKEGKCLGKFSITDVKSPSDRSTDKQRQSARERLRESVLRSKGLEGSKSEESWSSDVEEGEIVDLVSSDAEDGEVVEIARKSPTETKKLAKKMSNKGLDNDASIVVVKDRDQTVGGKISRKNISGRLISEMSKADDVVSSDSSIEEAAPTSQVPLSTNVTLDVSSIKEAAPTSQVPLSTNITLNVSSTNPRYEDLETPSEAEEGEVLEIPNESPTETKKITKTLLSQGLAQCLGGASSSASAVIVQDQNQAVHAKISKNNLSGRERSKMKKADDAVGTSSDDSSEEDAPTSLSTNITLNVSSTSLRYEGFQTNYAPCSDHDSALSLTDDELQPICPKAKKGPTPLDKFLNKGESGFDESGTDSEDDFSVTDIQEAMPECCWMISERDRYQRSSPHYTDYLRCRRCYAHGHSEFDCGKAEKIPVCYCCGEEGHECPKSASQCPNAACSLCWSPGHMKKHCPHQWIKTYVCSTCGAMGHAELQCSDAWKDDNRTDLEEGERPRAAPSFPRTVGSQKMWCCNCGKEGHLFHECGDALPNYDGYFPNTRSDGESSEESLSEVQESEDTDSKKLSFRDFLRGKIDLKICRERKRKPKKKLKSLSKMDKQKRKRQKKHRRDRQKLHKMYDEGVPLRKVHQHGNVSYEDAVKERKVHKRHGRKKKQKKERIGGEEVDFSESLWPLRHLKRRRRRNSSEGERGGTRRKKRHVEGYLVSRRRAHKRSRM